jgi:SM-20-related protein
LSVAGDNTSSVCFFRDLGLFVTEDFLNHDSCRRLVAELKTASFEKATIVKDGHDGVLDENSRKVSCISVAEETWSAIRQQFQDIKPKLEEHFCISLSMKCHGPDFLTYQEGSFYRPHRDASERAPDHINKRRVSVVVFLNPQSQEPAPDSFGGGGLAFYGLLNGPQWEKCAFTLQPAPGLLVAFRSDLLHEVQPVTFGERHTVVTWFLAETESEMIQAEPGGTPIVPGQTGN